MEIMENFYQDILKNARDMQNFWENRTSQMLDEYVKSQTFIGAMTKSLESSLDARKILDASVSRWAEMFNIVTKKEFDRLNQQTYDGNVRLQKIESGIQEMTRLMERQIELLAKIAKQPATAPAQATPEKTVKGKGAQGKREKA
ncbi:MAG: hypothetical protein HQM09_12945 [Candidatus Riflebacteria bacterium]|nr:hypothetical protein [Candidatus Riflebacteria bacterium]